MAGRLDGKVAVVTGGGNGIGRACCRRLAQEGAVVVVADLQEHQAKAVAEEIASEGGRALGVHVDAADADSNEAMVARAVEDCGGVDVVVTAAGVSHADYVSGDRDGEARRLAQAAAALQDRTRALTDLTLGDWQRVLDINLTGTFLAVQAAARWMVAAGRRGSLITIASVAAKRPDAGPLAYTVSKAGVWMLTKHAARSLAPAGIRVNAIGPGFIETNMTRIVAELPLVRDQVLTAIPMARMGQPEEVAAVAAFLASDDASYVTGEIIHPDGGYFTE